MTDRLTELTWSNKQACGNSSPPELFMEEDANFILNVVSKQNCIRTSAANDVLPCMLRSVDVTLS